MRSVVGCLRLCAEQLCNIFHIIFMKSLELQMIPVIWKHSIIVPVPKCTKPKSLSELELLFSGGCMIWGMAPTCVAN